MTETQPIVTHVETTIAVLTDDLIAPPNIMEVVKWAKVHKQQMDNAKKVYDEAVKILKDFMMSAETLISPDGCRVATYKQAENRLQLDMDALKREFNDVYVTCCNEVPGNRTFLLK